MVPFAGNVLSVKDAHAFRRAVERRVAAWQQRVTKTQQLRPAQRPAEVLAPTFILRDGTDG